MHDGADLIAFLALLARLPAGAALRSIEGSRMRHFTSLVETTAVNRSRPHGETTLKASSRGCFERTVALRCTSPARLAPIEERRVALLGDSLAVIIITSGLVLVIEEPI